MTKDKEKIFDRFNAAKYMHVTSNTLKRYPVPFMQYRKGAKAMYKKSDLDKFTEESMHYPEKV